MQKCGAIGHRASQIGDRTQRLLHRRKRCRLFGCCVGLSHEGQSAHYSSMGVDLFPARRRKHDGYCLDTDNPCGVTPQAQGSVGGVRIRHQWRFPNEPSSMIDGQPKAI